MGKIKLDSDRPNKPWAVAGIVGTTVNGLRVQRTLGRGSFGTVYKVLRQADSERYALKTIDTKSMSHRGRQAAVNEISLLASVNNSYVLQFFEAFVHGELLCIVTEFAPCGDLAKRLAQLQLSETLLPESVVWSYFIQLCLGLNALHSVNIVHRDLKPANVLLISNHHLKIGDLGISKVLTASDGTAKTQCGTPAYFSPELWRRQPYNCKTDVWSLGVLLYEMMALRLPFKQAKNVLWGAFPQVLAGEGHPYSALLGESQATLCLLVRNCLRATGVPSTSCVLSVR